MAVMSHGLDVLERNARRLAQLIEDLLAASSIIAGRLTIERRPVDVAAVLQEALSTVLPEVLAKRLDVNTALAPGIGPVMGDGVQLGRALAHILANAVKFTPAGGRVTVTLEPGGDGQACTAVTDGGPGIAPDTLPHLFDLFRHVDGAPTRRHAGLGLGLALARHLVEAHGGTVEAREARPGTTFFIELPGGARDARLPAGAPGPRDARLEGLVILVVDDHADTREVLRLALERAGATVREADSVAEAIRITGEGRPDMVVTDLAMPGEDGFALLRELQARLRSMPPVVAVSAHASASDRARALEAGFAEHVAKPVAAADLVAAVRQSIRLPRTA